MGRAFDETIHSGEEAFLVTGLWFPWIPSAYQNQGFESRRRLNFFFRPPFRNYYKIAPITLRLSSFIQLT